MSALPAHQGANKKIMKIKRAIIELTLLAFED
jgi:hypothetical protein